MKTKLMIAFVATCLSGTVFAAGSDYSSGTSQSGSTSAPNNFNQLDSDNDGSLTKSELSNQPALKEDWARIDANSDGRIDRAEFSMFEANEDADTSMGSTPSSTYR